MDRKYFAVFGLGLLLYEGTHVDGSYRLVHMEEPHYPYVPGVSRGAEGLTGTSAAVTSVIFSRDDGSRG